MIPDDYIVASCERTGYPPWIDEGFGRDCPQCEEPIMEYAMVFEINGVEVCKECFKEWVLDYLSTNPEDIANALDIPHHTWEG